MVTKDPKKNKGKNQTTLPRDTFDIDRFASQYSIPAAIINSDPEILEVIKWLQANPDAPMADVVLKLQETNWGKKTSTNKRYWESFSQTRPTDFELVIGEIQTKVETQYKKAGLTIGQSEARDMATKLLYGSDRDESGNLVRFDQKWVDRQIANSIDFTKTRTVGGVQVLDVSGSAEKVAQDLYSVAYNYGIDSSMSNQAFKDWFGRTARAVMAGDMDMQQADDEIVDMARSRFPGMSSYFDRGINLRTAADPWIQTIKDVLEVGDVDLNDDLFQRIVNNTDEQGNFRPMSLYEARLAARKDARWDYTGQAKEEKTDIASKILADFGFLG